MKNYFEQPFILVRKKNIKKVNYMVREDTPHIRLLIHDRKDGLVKRRTLGSYYWGRNPFVNVDFTFSLVQW
jgi:hypothetical protein